LSSEGQTGLGCLQNVELQRQVQTRIQSSLGVVALCQWRILILEGINFQLQELLLKRFARDDLIAACLGQGRLEQRVAGLRLFFVGSVCHPVRNRVERAADVGTLALGIAYF
jgi:hypothetical protein